MCSVGDDNIEQEGARKFMAKTVNILSDKCNKCREEKPVIMLRGKDCYCRGCFLAATTHKFKALLGKHRMIHPNDRVLVLHRAGYPSTALLHFLRSGLDLTTPKKLRFQPVFLYIDDQLYLTEQERMSLCKNIEQQVKSFNFNIYFISLLAFLRNTPISNILVDNSEKLVISENDNISDIFEKKLSKTNRNDILNAFRRNILLDAAKQLNCKFVFTPDLSVDVASHLLTNISLGRGIHIPLDTGFCDLRDPEVKILRPLRQFEIKELAMYNVFNMMEPVFVREYHENPYSSIQDLMHKFITDLQVNYPATVTTILKTGDKLALNQESTGDMQCSFCKGPLESKSLELSSAESTHFSHWLSTHEPDYSLSPQERYNVLLGSFQNQESDGYCYSCRKLAGYMKT